MSPKLKPRGMSQVSRSLWKNSKPSSGASSWRGQRCGPGERPPQPRPDSDLTQICQICLVFDANGESFDH